MSEPKTDMLEGATVVERPLVIIYQADDGNTIAHIHPPFDWTHQHYGLLICDLVRHVAAVFHVPEDKIWYWVEKERRRPTTTTTTIKDAFPRPQ
jgi:hypothetical protein